MFGTLSIYVSVNDFIHCCPMYVWVVLVSHVPRPIVPLTCCMIHVTIFAFGLQCGPPTFQLPARALWQIKA